MKNLLTKILLVCLVVLGMAGQAWGTEVVYKSLTFTSTTMQTDVSSYTSSFTTICSGFSWTINNFNNNNRGWTAIRCGRKSNASTATIVTSTAIDKPVTKVVVTIDAINASKTNSIKLQVATNSTFTSGLQEVSITKSTGNQTAVVVTPTANCYYKLVFNCASGSENGFDRVSKVDYYVDEVSTTVSLNKSSTSISIGGTETLIATRENPADAPLTWTSSDTSVATVTSGGVVTAVAEGTATIKAALTSDATIYATCTVTVTDPRMAAATGLSITPATPLVHGRTGTFDLSGTFAPDEASNTITWASSDATVIDVNSTTGAFSALKAGTAKITATVTPSDAVTYKPVTEEVEYTVNAVSASFNDASKTILVGETFTNTLTLTNTSGAVTYTSDDTDVATVAPDGTVTGVAPGTTTITASVAAVVGVSAATSASYTVTVIAPTYYTKVTDVSELAADKHYLLVYENGASSQALGAVTTIGSNIGVSVITENGENTIIITTQEVNVLTLSKSDSGKWLFTTSLESANLCWESGNTLTTTSYSTTSEAQWTIDISNGSATIKSVKDNTRVIRYNTSYTRFACYASSTGVLPTIYMEDTRTAPTLTKSAEWIDPLNMLIGDTWTDNTISENSDATGTYGSDDDGSHISLNSSTGAVTALAETESSVTVTFSLPRTETNKAASESYQLNVVKPDIATIASITPSKTSLNYGEGGTTAVVATIYNDLEDASDKYDRTFTSSNTSVLTVNESTGAYTAVTDGTATITVTYAPKPAYTARYKTVQMTSDDITVTDTREAVATIGDITPNSMSVANTGTFSTELTDVPDGFVLNTDYTVSYEATSGADCLTVGSNGSYTVVKAGEVTVKVTVTPTSAHNSTHKPVFESFDITVNRLAPTVNFATASVRRMKDDNSYTQIATSNSDGAITYSSSNSDVATVNATTGEVTFVAAGTVTISASTAQTDVYETGNASYTLTVVPPSELPAYVLVESEPDNWSGDYLIVYTDGNVAFDGGLTTLDASGNSISVTINNKQILADETTNAAKFTIAKVGDTDNYTIKSASDYYIGRTAASNGLDSDQSTEYTHTISLLDGDAVITSSGGYVLNYNSVSNQIRFRYYNNTQEKVQLYKYNGISATYHFKKYNITTGEYDIVDATDDSFVLGDNQLAFVNDLTDDELDAMPSAMRNKTNVVVNGVAKNLTLTDKVNYYAPSSFTAEKFHYARTNTLGYNTVCLPIAITSENKGDIFGDEAKVYVLQGLFEVSGIDRFRFQEAATNGSNSVDAGIPVLVYNATTTAWDCEVENESVTGETPELPSYYPRLHGTFTAIPKGVLGTNHYKMNSAGTAFVRTTANSSVQPFRFYLECDPEADVPAQVFFSLFDWDDTDGLRTLDADDVVLDSNEAWYDMSGRRIPTPHRNGIYLHGGRKVVMK